MTTLNTIIEEEKKEFDRRTDASNYEMAEMEYGTIKIGSDTLLDESWYPESSYEIDGEKVKDFLATAMQRAYEAGAEERDTYWKERVRKEIRGHLKECKGWNTDCPQNCVLRHVHVPCTCDGWLPMELAPKDGTHILVSNDRLCTVAHYFEGDTGGGWYLSWNEYDKSSSYQMDTITKWKKI